MKKIFLFFLLFTSLVGGFFGCSGKEVNENNPEELYKEAEEEVKDKKYLSALEKLKNIKNRFPYSNFSTKAALRVGDVHFLEEQFTEAAASFEAFRDLHPKHEKADYVIFMIGESYFNQLPSSEDRDLTPGTKAIEAYTELQKIYPASEHVAKAQEHSKETTERLAKKEKYIADFYFIRDQFDSAAKRYEKITTNFSGSKVEEYAYWRWSDSITRQAQEAEKDEEKAKFLEQTAHVYKVYLSKFPEGDYAPRARRELERLGEKL